MKKFTALISILIFSVVVWADITVTPYGAAGIVSGSCFLIEAAPAKTAPAKADSVETDSDAAASAVTVSAEADANDTVSSVASSDKDDSVAVMVDCGLFMRGDLEGSALDEKNEDIEPELVNARALVLTHAHTDHCGKIPLLIHKGFKGKIYCASATKDLALALFKNRTGFENIPRKWFWSQSQMFNAKRNKKPVVIHWTKNCKNSIKNVEETSQDMSMADAEKEAGINFYLCKNCSAWETENAIAPFFAVVEYNSETEIAADFKFRLINAGHIPGSASVVFTVQNKTIVFSGDLGNGFSRLTGIFDVPEKADALFAEATYADDKYKLDFKDYEIFRKDLLAALKKGNTVWIPALAFNRTQKILYEINLMKREGLLDKKIPVYSVSPSANAINDLYQKESQNKSGGWFLDEVYKTGSVLPKDLRQQMVREYDSQKIVISASGDMDYGMSQQLRNIYISKKDVSIMIVNYVGPGSTASNLLSGRFKSSQFKRRASIKKYDIFSDHPDFDILCKWLSNQEKSAKICIIHSSAQNAAKMKKLLNKKGWKNIFTASEKQKIII
ncbi:MAG: MBL fold metallo-hydrolase [Endomicrobium sp.]|jgi:metallo-beta-lactamase family protein|nr:MBL fold metallo-hydrolase [Endomicrobium sp.]